MPKTCLIINPVSGPARRGPAARRVDVARRALDRLSVDAEIRLTERAGHAHELAAEAVAAKAELVIAWGGDGTINEVGRALVQVGAALGIIPGGSGNGLARNLGIPFDPERAIERAMRAEARRIDAGELAGRLFFNIAGVGLDAHVAAIVSTRVRHRGFVPYFKATFRDLVRYRPVDYTLTADGRTVEARALLVAFANSRQYGFGAEIAPRAALDDGLLDVVIVEDRGLAGNMARVPALFRGTADRQNGVQTMKAGEITIRSREPMLFHVDGEAMQGTDTLTARVHRGALLLRG